MDNKTIVAITMLFLIMAPVAVAEIDWSIYDLNNDGMIDASERIALDTDVENGRISLDEFAEAGEYTTTDSSIIATVPYNTYLTRVVTDRHAPVIIESPVVEPEPVIANTIVRQEVIPEQTPDAPKDNHDTVRVFIAFILITTLVIIGTWTFYNKRREE